MAKKESRLSTWLARQRQWWRRRKGWQRRALIGLIIVALFVSCSWLLAQWYIMKHRHEPLEWGTTFIPDYARYLDLDPKDTLHALLTDLGFRRVRFVSYWSDIEPTPGQYDFSQLDWQFDMAEQVGAKVTLSIGLRQPRWPECQTPAWINGMKQDEWLPHLLNFMQATIEHYKDRPSLQSYQLENEFFLSVFGACSHYGYDRQRLITEFNFVKSLDSKHPIIMSLANNYFGIPLGQPRPDEYGVSVYKRVWDQTVTHRYFEYPFPAWYYSSRSALMEIFTGKESMLHELQAEPWGPADIKLMSIQEQSKSMDATRLRERITYAKATGYRQIDFWGAEWWYWRLTKFHDPSLWNVVKTGINKQ